MSPETDYPPCHQIGGIDGLLKLWAQRAVQEPDFFKSAAVKLMARELMEASGRIRAPGHKECLYCSGGPECQHE